MVRRALRILVLGALLLSGAAWLQAADETGSGEPSSKLSCLLRAAIIAPSADGALDPLLVRHSARTSRANSLMLRLDCPVTAATLAAIRATGAVVMSTAPRWDVVRVEATLAEAAALAQLADIHAVVLVRPRLHRGQPGTYTNQADSVIATDQVRADYAVTGSGQSVGIISDSINDTPQVGHGTETGANPSILTGTIPQTPTNGHATGDLPTSIKVVDYGPSDPGNTDEGEAMMEEAYHLAPGASYGFGSAGDIDTDMATNIGRLQTQTGATVICDDVGFVDEPMFQDGPISQAANSFVASGGVYVSAAGNDADQGIMQTFNAVVPGADDNQSNGTPDPSDFQNWGPGTSGGFLPLVISGDLPTVTVILQWNEPFQSYNLGAGAQSDFDLYLFKAPSATTANIVASSTDVQGTIGSPTGDPVEVIQYDLTGNSQTLYLAVDHVRGRTTNLMRIIVDVAYGSLSSPVYSTVFGAGTTFGHPTAQNVMGIAAVPWQTPTILETYSSKGGWGAQGLPFYFDTSGNPLPGAPQLRNKPNITAPDNVTTSNPNFNPFAGTSAATPNAGAAAALLRCVYPSLSGTQIITAMQSTATDITHAPASSGPDAWSGYGLVNVIQAAGNPVVSVTSTTANGSYETGSIPIQVTFASPVTVAGGTPSLVLNTTPTRSATYTSSSGPVVTFTYTLSQGDLAPTLDVAGSTALQLNGATIDTVSNGAPADVLLPSPGASGSLSASSAIAIDAVGPTVSIVATPAISNQTAYTFAITFQRPVTGLTLSDLALSANLSPGTLSGSGASYSLPVTATATGALIVAIATNRVDDGVGYGNQAGSGSATYDTTRPTLTITPAYGSISNGDGDVFTFQFSKVVTNFTAAQIQVVHGTAGALSGSGLTYAMNVVANATGTMTVTVLAGTVTDQAGNTLAVGATAAVQVNAQSSKSCGLGSLFGVVLMLGIATWRRAGPLRRMTPRRD